MSIFKRGRVYWYHFLFNGQHIQESTRQGNPRVARQMEAAQVTAFENTGAGFYSTVSVPADAPRLPDEQSVLDGAHGSVNGVADAMGFIVFLQDGRLSEIEGYTHAIDSTAEIEFATVDFQLRPYGAGFR